MMKERIQQIMEMERMTQQEFATALEISPSSLSSIFNGRTNPTNNHVQAIHRRFPKISISWLMFGEGEMYADAPTQTESRETAGADTPTPTAATPLSGGISPSDAGGASMLPFTTDAATPAPADGSGGKNPYSSLSPIIRETVKYIDKPQRKITEIRIFFDDGTYETFQGSR